MAGFNDAANRNTAVTWPNLVPAAASLVAMLGLFAYSAVAGSSAGPPVSRSSAVEFAQAAAGATTPAAGTEAGSPRPEGASPSKAVELGGASLSASFAAEAGWVGNLRAEFDSSGGNGAQLLSTAPALARAEAEPSVSGSMTVGWPLLDELPQLIIAQAAGSTPPRIEAIERARTMAQKEAASSSPGEELQSMAVEFAPGSARVSPRGLRLLRRAAEAIKRLPRGTAVELDGYTDASGSPAFNLRLSQERAQSVYRALLREGVDSSILRAKGLGEVPAVATAGGQAEGRSAALQPKTNARRVEFHISPPG